MIEAYNYYLGGYLPKTTKSSVHDTVQLKGIYSKIVKRNKQSPLSMVRLSDDKQAYALDVKEMSLNLVSSTTESLDFTRSDEEIHQSLSEVTDTFNQLLSRSDEFGKLNGKPSRPGGELRSLVSEFGEELTLSGFSIDEESHLTMDDEGVQAPINFLRALRNKSQAMSIDPMEYIDKKVFSYAFLSNTTVGSAYTESAYSGMLFNSYC